MSYKPIPVNQQLASKFIDDSPKTKEYYDKLIMEEIFPQKKSPCHMFRCPFMITKRELKQHLIDHHLLHYKCASCQQLFRSSSFCRRHMAHCSIQDKPRDVLPPAVTVNTANTKLF